MSTLTDTRPVLDRTGSALRIRQVTDWRAILAHLAPLIASALLLVLALAHLRHVWNVQSPHEQWELGFPIDRLSAWKPWSRDVYRQLVLSACALLGLGLLARGIGRRRTWARRPARPLLLAGASAVLAAQLWLSTFYELGLGFPAWTWELPLRLALLTIALSALLLVVRRGPRWPRYTLLLGVLGLAFLWVTPRQARDTWHPMTLSCPDPWQTCTRAHPACTRAVATNRRASVVPLLRAAATARERSLLRDLIGKNLDCLEGRSCRLAQHATRDSAAFRDSVPGRLHRDHLRVSRWHYAWQDVRLVGFALLLLFGVPLTLLVFFGRATAARIPLLGCAALSLICATGLAPAWSFQPPWQHVLGALPLPLAVLLLGLTFAAPGPDQPGNAFPDRGRAPDPARLVAAGTLRADDCPISTGPAGQPGGSGGLKWGDKARARPA